MSIVVRFAPAGTTTQQYEEVFRRLEESGNWPPDGLDYHVAFGPSSDLRGQRDLGFSRAVPGVRRAP